MTTLLTTVLLSSGIAGPPRLGEIYAAFDGGASLAERPSVRLSAGVLWLPFAEDAWAGLNEVGARGEVFFTAAADGNLAILFWVGYGRPRAQLWFGFDAGIGSVVGWHQGSERAEFLAAAPLAAVRIGYGPVGLRLTGFITNHGGAINNGYYTLTVEGLLAL